MVLPEALRYIAHNYTLIRGPIIFLEKVDAQGNRIDLYPYEYREVVKKSQLKKREAEIEAHPEIMQPILTDGWRIAKVGNI